MHTEHFDIHYSAGYAPLGIPEDALFTANDQPERFATVTVQTPETHRERTIVINHWRAWQRVFGDTETMNIIDQLDARGY